MKFAKSVAHGIAGVLLFIFLVCVWILIMVEKCERWVSDDEMSGMAAIVQEETLDFNPDRGY